MFPTRKGAAFAAAAYGLWLITLLWGAGDPWLAPALGLAVALGMLSGWAQGLALRRMPATLTNWSRWPACSAKVAEVRRARCVAGLLAAALLTGPALANDGFAELAAGGVVTFGRNLDVAIAQELLEVSARQVRVEYRFQRRPGSRPDSVTMAFPLPLYSAELPSWEWAGEPLGFEVRVEDKPQAFKTVVRARSARCEDGSLSRHCGDDVTAQLKAAGLSDEQMALFPGATPFREPSGQVLPVAPLTPTQRGRLRSSGLVASEGPSGERDYPNWIADVSYVWQLDLPNAAPVKVTHQYTPFGNVGSDVYDATENMLRNDYCANDAEIDAWKRMVATAPEPYGRAAVSGRRVDYILTTANTWSGPIGDFRLRLRKSQPAELVLLCFPGKFRKLDALTVEVQLQDFQPRSELRVIFLNTLAKEADLRNQAPRLR